MPDLPRYHSAPPIFLVVHMMYLCALTNIGRSLFKTPHVKNILEYCLRLKIEPREVDTTQVLLSGIKDRYDIQLQSVVQRYYAMMK